MVPDPLTDAPNSCRRWAIFALGSLNFVLSMFYRATVAIMTPDLVRDLGMTSSQLSELSAAFFYSFAACQVPLGIAIDRWGPRLSIGLLSVAAVTGAAAFAVGQTHEQLMVARVLLGIGMSGNLMCLLVLLAAWFPDDRFASVSAMAIAIGNVGSALAGTPLAVLNDVLGWRGSFGVFASVNAVIAGAFVAVSRNHPPGTRYVATERRGVVAGLRVLIRLYSFWAISLATFMRYGYFAALQSFVLGPFLVFGMRYDTISAGNALVTLAVGYIVALPLWGVMSDRVVRSRKRVVIGGLVTFAAATASLLFWPQEVPYGMVLAAFFVLGLTSASGQVMYAHVKELLPPDMAGRAMTSINLFTVLGVAVMIHVFGFLLAEDPSALAGPAGFSSIWWTGVVGLACVTVLYSLVPDSVPKNASAERRGSDIPGK